MNFKLFMVSNHIKDTFKSRSLSYYSDASGYTSFSGEGDIDIDDIVCPDDRSLSPDVRSHGPIDVDTCRKAQHNKSKKKKKSMKRLGSNTSSFGRTSSFIKKELLNNMCSSRVTIKKKVASTQASNGVVVYEDTGSDSSSGDGSSLPMPSSTDSIQLIQSEKNDAVYCTKSQLIV